ncbi:MAG: DEAD/DEAH box helicase [Gemmatimonadaceae bacterium]
MTPKKRKTTSRSGEPRATGNEIVGGGSDRSTELFHPVVGRWFAETLGAPSEPQRRGWPAIASGDHTLILAPTGTGKTLAAFLYELNALICEGIATPLANAVQILYVSPLKALSNDVHRNLERPLVELRGRFEREALPFPDIRVAVRTGDTPSAARQRMLRRTPHILITTPESLHIMLTTIRGRGMFSGVRAVIVDEIHALAGGKRGAHLALALERLERLCAEPPQRIGLSATQRPLDEIARFLGGLIPDPHLSAADSPTPHSPRVRPVTIVDCGLVKKLEARTVSPVGDLGSVGGTIWPAVAEVVVHYAQSARTTLVFVNNRAQAERMAARVNSLAGEELAQPYHGSLARERRVALESRLKAGELRALVTTSSLELGIDIGSVDLVLQLQSPKRVTSALQRIGRAGHTLGAVSRGVFVPTFRDDAVEILAICRAMREGDVEPTRVVQNSLDVLAQVIVAAVSIDDWTSATLYDVVRRAYPYHRLTRSAFDEVVSMLSGKYPSELAAELEARITWDRTTDRLSGSRASRMTAVISGGTIPDRGLYTVNLPDRTRLGELDEEFVHESRVGDAFQLGSATWRIAAIEHDRVIVTPAPGVPARMPFWHGEYAARSFHLSARIGELRREAAGAAGNDEAIERLASSYECDLATATSLVNYVSEQRAATGVVPDERSLVLEHFRDETGAVRLVLHAPFGGRVNAPWGMAVSQRVREMLGDRVDVQVQTTDDGIMLRSPDPGAVPPVHALLGMSAAEGERRVLEEVGKSSLFGARFRMNAARALLLPRGTPRRRMPLWLQRLKALDLLQTVREHPSFPILVETYRDVLQDVFDVDGLLEVLAALESGRMTVHVVATDRPSPFAASLQFGFVIDWLYGNDTPRAEQRAALLSLDRAMLDELMGTRGADDEMVAAIDEILAQRRGTAPGRRARTADELAALLDRAGDLTPSELEARVATVDEGRRGDPIAELATSGRAIGVRLPAAGGVSATLVILTEAYPRYVAAFGADAVARVFTGSPWHEAPAAAVVPAILSRPTLTRAAARREVLARFVALAGPIAPSDAHSRYGVDSVEVEQFLTDWERSGQLVRGMFGRVGREVRWCARKVVDRARRSELAAARRDVQAVDLPVLAAFLQRWQNLHPHTRLAGRAGTDIALHKLLGIARPAAAWERDYLPSRVNEYDPSSLSHLTGSGQLVWVGGGTVDEATGVRNLSTVQFIERGDARAWLHEPPPALVLSEAARGVLAALESGGAAFLADLEAAVVLAPHTLRDALRELVAAGLATNDTAEALREITRWRVFPLPAPNAGPDPTRWLPADFSPSSSRPIVQRRASMRRLPRWRRPDRGPSPTLSGWEGRWSLVRTSGTLGPQRPEEELAGIVAHQWLLRYGVVSSDWWRRERPAVSWRAIYRELRRMEYRGDVRRGYFVRGLGGAQFATAEAVEQLRERPADPPAIAMLASDPANPYSLKLAGAVRDPLTRPRGRGGILVTRHGTVVLSAEARGKRIAVARAAPREQVGAAVTALVAFLRGADVLAQRSRDLVVETIDGDAATTSPHADAFRTAGFRSMGNALRYLPQ